MGRPKKLVPSVYWLVQKSQWCANIGGKRRLLGTDHAAAERECLRLVNEHLAAAAPTAPSQDAILAGAAVGNLTVLDVLFAYTRQLRRDLNQAHRFRIDKALAAVEDAYGGLPASRLSPLHVVEVRNRLVAAPEGYSRNYVNSLIQTVKTCWAWAVANCLVIGPYALAITKVRALREGEGGRELPPRAPADLAAVEATLPHLPPMLRAVVELLRLTGARPGELLGLRRGDLSAGPGERLEPLPGWFVAGTADVWLACPAKHKTKGKGKARVIAFGPRAREILKPWLFGLAANDVVFSPRKAEEMRHAEQRRNRKTRVQPSQRRRRVGNPNW